MLSYIYNYFLHFLITADSDRTKSEQLNLKTFGIYNSQFVSDDSGMLVHPSALIDISINGILQYTNKIQRHNVSVDVHVSQQLPSKFTTLETLNNSYLELMKLSDKVFVALEQTNGAMLPNFNSTTDIYFSDNLHRSNVVLTDIQGLNKTSVITFEFLLLDFSALPTYDIVTDAELIINTTY